MPAQTTNPRKQRTIDPNVVVASTSRTSHNDIDSAAAGVAQRALRSSARSRAKAERNARWALAALVYGSDIPETVVRRATRGKGVPIQVMVDSQDYVREQLTKLIVGPNPKLELERLAQGSSLCGWASRIISGPAVFPKKNFDSRRRLIREVTVSDDTISGLLAVRSMADFGVNPVFFEDGQLDLVEQFEILSRGLREWESVHLSAEHICLLSAVKAPRRAACARNRNTLLRRVNADVLATRNDLSTYLSTDNFELSPIARLFDNLRFNEMANVARLEPLASQLLARSALTPVPPPRHAVVRALKSLVAPEVGGIRQAGDLTRAYVDVVTEVAGSEFTPDASTRHIKKVSQRRADFVKWEVMVDGLLSSGFDMLGDSPDVVLANLSRRVRQISIVRAQQMSA